MFNFNKYKKSLFLPFEETINRSNFKYLRSESCKFREIFNIWSKNIRPLTQGHVDTTAIIKNIKIIDKSWILNLK